MTAITLAGVRVALEAKGFTPYAAHQREMEEGGCGDPAPEGMENMWIDRHCDWVVKLGDNSYAVYQDGDFDDAVEEGDFAGLLYTLDQYEPG